LASKGAEYDKDQVESEKCISLSGCLRSENPEFLFNPLKKPDGKKPLNFCYGVKNANFEGVKVIFTGKTPKIFRLLLTLSLKSMILSPFWSPVGKFLAFHANFHLKI